MTRPDPVWRRPCVHVSYRFTESLGDEQLAAAVALLSPAERCRYERLVFERDRRDYAFAHALLRTALSSHDGRPPEEWRFEHDAHGKPFVAPRHAAGDPKSSAPVHVWGGSSGWFETSLRFSLTHSSGLVACAVAAGTDVGIDAASLGRAAGPALVGPECFSPSELARLHQLTEWEQRTCFCELWTLKEAFAKAAGRGIALPLAAVTFDLTRGQSITMTVPPRDRRQRWACAVFAPGKLYRLALVLCTPGDADCGMSIRIADGARHDRAPLVRATSSVFVHDGVVGGP